MKTLVIAGNIAQRFDGKTRMDKAEIDPGAPNLHASLEEFRLNGLPEEEKHWTPAPANPEVLTFNRIVRELAP